jgi:hypothetical protein
LGRGIDGLLGFVGICLAAADNGELEFAPIGRRDHQAAVVGQHAPLLKSGNRAATCGKDAVQKVEEFSFQFLLGLAFCFHGIVSPLKGFRLFAKNVFRQTGGQEIHDHLGGGVRRLAVPSAIEVGDNLLVRNPLQPEFRNPAIVQFVAFAFGVLGKNQDAESVPVDFSLDPGTAYGCPVGLLGDHQVVADFEVLGKFLVGFVVCVHRLSPLFGMQYSSVHATLLLIFWKTSRQFPQNMPEFGNYSVALTPDTLWSCGERRKFPDNSA